MNDQLFDDISQNHYSCWGISECESDYIDDCMFSKSLKLGARQIRNILIILEEKINIPEDKEFRFFVGNDLDYENEPNIYRDKNGFIDMLLNPNSLDLILHGDLSRYSESVDRINEFINTLIEYGENPKEYYIDSTGVLGLYGIRPVGDIDFLKVGNWPRNIETEGMIENNNKYSSFHSVSIDELINNSNFFLLYRGIKVTTLQELKAWKLNKNKKKDREDVFLIDHFYNRSLCGYMYRWFILTKRDIKIFLFKLAHLFYK